MYIHVSTDQGESEILRHAAVIAVEAPTQLDAFGVALGNSRHALVVAVVQQPHKGKP